MRTSDKFLVGLAAVLVCAATVIVADKVSAVMRAARLPSPLIHLENWEDLLQPGSQIGPDSAVVTIVEFVDYSCWPCKALNLHLDPVLSDSPDRVALVIRHLPQIDTASHAIAAGAVCADIFAGFEGYHRIALQGERGAFAPDSVVAWAVRAGVVDTAGFRRCLRSAVADERITSDMMVASRLGITATPTYFINGDRYQGGQPRIRELIEAKLHETTQGRDVQR